MISFTSHRVAQITRMYIFAILELAAKIAAGSRMCGCQASQVNLHARKVPCIQRQLIKCVEIVSWRQGAMTCSMDGATLVEKQKRKGRGEDVIGEILFALTDILDEIADISDIIADLTRSRLIQLREIINPTPSIHE